MVGGRAGLIGGTRWDTALLGNESMAHQRSNENAARKTTAKAAKAAIGRLAKNAAVCLGHLSVGRRAARALGAQGTLVHPTEAGWLDRMHAFTVSI